MFLCLIAERYSLTDLKLRLSARSVTYNIYTLGKGVWMQVVSVAEVVIMVATNSVNMM